METYLYQGCRVKTGIPHCQGMVTATCKLYNAYIKTIGNDNVSSFLCEIENTNILMDSCTYSKDTQSVRCCENLSGPEMNCRHFVMKGEENAFSVALNAGSKSASEAKSTLAQVPRNLIQYSRKILGQKGGKHE